MAETKSSFEVGDYVKFKHHGHNQQGDQEHIGRVEKNPAEGLMNGGFVPIQGLMSILYLSRPDGHVERITRKADGSECTLVLKCTHKVDPESFMGMKVDEYNEWQSKQKKKVS